MNNLKSLFPLSLLAASLIGCASGPENSNGAAAAPASSAAANTPAVVAQIIETDDIGLPGNDIESVSIEIKKEYLIVSQNHKAAKGDWHRIRIYLTLDDANTVSTPIAEGAAGLKGLAAEYGYSFEYTGSGWNTIKKNASGGTWVAAGSAASAIGGNTELTTILIPLSEIGNPSNGSTMKMMFVGTGNGWGTDQAPNNGMYEYVIEAP